MMGKKTKTRLFNRCGDLDKAWDQLQAWYRTPLGTLVAEAETALIDRALSDLFGYYLLQVGRLQDADWLQASRVSFCEVMDFSPESGSQEKHTGFKGLPFALPIQSDSLDVVLLPHVLEFSQQPHAVLREVERVLIPNGHVVILVFNPLSLWSFWRWTVGWTRRAPWCGRFMSTTRVKDWMELLGFDVTHLQGYFFRPPIQKTGVMEKLRFSERVGQRLWPILGASHLIVAKKRVTTLTPIKPRWRPGAKLVAPGLVEPFQNKRKHEQQ